MRRPPDVAPASAPLDRARWVAVDLASDADERVLTEAFEGHDAVVHLAWGFQPGRDDARLRATAVDGTIHVARVAVRAGVPHPVHTCSVGAYAPRFSLDPVDESYPTTGDSGSAYSRDKSDVERVLGGVEAEHPGLAVAAAARSRRPGRGGQRAAALRAPGAGAAGRRRPRARPVGHRTVQPGGGAFGGRREHR